MEISVAAAAAAAAMEVKAANMLLTASEPKGWQCTDHSTCRRCLNQQPEELLLQPSQWQSQCQFSIMMCKVAVNTVKGSGCLERTLASKWINMRCGGGAWVGCSLSDCDRACDLRLLLS